MIPEALMLVSSTPTLCTVSPWLQLLLQNCSGLRQTAAVFVVNGSLPSLFHSYVWSVLLSARQTYVLYCLSLSWLTPPTCRYPIQGVTSSRVNEAAMQCLDGADLPHARTLSVKTASLPSEVASGKCAAADSVLTTASCILYPAVSALPRPSHRRRRKICLRAFIQNCLKFRFHQMQHLRGVM